MALNSVEMCLVIENLSIQFPGQAQAAVCNVNCTVPKGGCLGLVGESGSGKSLTALCILQLLPSSARVAERSRIVFNGEDLLAMSERRMQTLRGHKIGIVFQDALTALNPVATIGQQLCEVIRVREKKKRAYQLLDEVGISSVMQCYRSYPHQLSGGMRQRALIAMALAGEPELLIADEPTTALDVTTQAQIIALLQRLQRQRKMSLLFISHDLALVAQLAKQVVVLQQGCVRESGTIERVFDQPRSDYTRQLIAAVPTGQVKLRSAPKGAPLLSVSGLKVHFPIKKGVFKRTKGWVKAVDGVDLTLKPKETLAIVGESGSGKTTCGLALLRLIESTAGEVIFQGESLLSLSRAEQRRRRHQMQIVFQDSFASLNPRRTVGESVVEGLLAQGQRLTVQAATVLLKAVLTQVQLPIECVDRYPHEFSGGQRQRLCLARALAVRPSLLVLDEPTSALDVSIQRQILNLLLQLQQQHNLAYLLITHDLGVVAELAHRVLVLFEGRVVESGSVTQVLTAPQHPYTQQLLAAMPSLEQLRINHE